MAKLQTLRVLVSQSDCDIFSYIMTTTEVRFSVAQNSDQDDLVFTLGSAL